MRRGSVTPQAKGKSRSLQKLPSSGLVDYLQAQYPKRIPVAALTAASKAYGRGKAITREDAIIKRLAGSASDIPTQALVDLLNNEETHQKGKQLSDEAVRRVYKNFANPEGKLTFQYVMKMGESSGVTITEKMAKAIVKKYGKKDHMNVDDCIRVNSRRASKSLKKDRR